MLLTLQATSELIAQNKLLHISASQELLKKLPQGNWIGGSSEFRAMQSEVEDTKEKLCVFELDFGSYNIKNYNQENVADFTADTYDNGFSIVIIPAETDILQEYAKKCMNFKDLFLKNVVGWIAGSNTSEPPIAVNGQTGEVFANEAVILNVSLPAEKLAIVNVVNIFSANENSPQIEFTDEGFSAKTFLVDGKEAVIVDYAKENNIDLQLPLVAAYYGAEVNASVVNIDDNKVITFGAPLFPGIIYRFAKPQGEYSEVFRNRIQSIKNKECLFSCNCISNMMHGDLLKYDLGGFYGPYVYGEIAYQLVNQTLVYLQIV